MPDLSDAAAIQLLHGLVAVPSVSCEEAAASAWLVEQMATLAYDRAYIDDAGNAVGEIGGAGASRVVVLLGHIDTVPGDIPVRIVDGGNGPVLYGRGSVDAKGPLATFASAVARLGGNWARANDIRIVVVGAVEEEAATSRGARFIGARFDGVNELIPAACIIGEPSSWRRVTLGYKGRILVEMDASQPMAHTAGPDPGVATVAVNFWTWLDTQARVFNQGHERPFDQLLPSLRTLRTWTDDEMHDHIHALAGIRLPLDFDIDAFRDDLKRWGRRVEEGGSIVVKLATRGYEPAWRSDRNNGLVRSFLAAIRGAKSDVRPGFVVKTGTSDMNVVGPLWACPILAYGPGDSALDHTPNEHISLDEYTRTVRVLEAALRHLPGALA